MATTKQILGKVVITNKGEWNSSNVYEVLDVVSYQGSSYISKVYDNNSLPTEDSKWQLLARKGDTYEVSEIDIENIAKQITENANSNFNKNITEKTETFNSNAETKITEFNENASTTVGNYNINAEQKLKRYNDNATSAVKNYNSNASTKLNEYNTNSSDKLKEYNDNASQKINEYDSHSKELNEKADSTRKELDRVKNEILEQGEANGSYIHLEDSAMAELQDLSIDGVLKQETTKGYNLVNLKTSQSDSYTYSDGIYTTKELKKNYEGIEIKHDNLPLSANDVVYYSAYIRLKTGTSVSMNAIETLSDKKTRTVISSPKLTSEFQKVIFKLTVAEDISYNASMYFQVGTITDIVVLEIKDAMITKEDPSNLLYEKFTGGQASPNIIFEQPIKVLTGSQKLTSCNKNLFNKNNFKILEGYYIGTNGNVGQVATNNIIYMPIKSNTSYSIQKILSNRFRVGTYNTLDILGKTLNNVIKNLDDTVTSYVLNNDNDKYLFFQYLGGDTNEQEILDSIQIEEGSIPTQFVEHQESSLTFDIPEGEFVGRIDDTYKDELSVVYNEEDGQFHKILKKKVGKYKFTGKENWRIGSTTDNYVEFSGNLPNLKASHYLITKSNGFLYEDNNRIAISSTGISYVRIPIISDKITLEKFKLFIPKIEVYYILAEPYEVDLGVCDIPFSYDKVTNIFTDNEFNPNISAKYYRNFTKTIQNLQINNDTLKNELLSIENRLTALENANTNAVNAEPVVESEVTK